MGPDIRVSLEFCGVPTCSVNQFQTAYDVVEEVGLPNVGVTLDTFHFHEMGSSLEALKKLTRRRSSYTT